MRIFTPATADHFASRGAFSGHILAWFRVRHRASGMVEPIGFWSGDDHRDFTIDGETRTYYGAGAFIAMDPIRRQAGITTKTQRMAFSHIAPAALALLSDYELRHAPVEIHRALFDPATDVLLDEPHIILAGFVDTASVNRPPKNDAGGAVSIEIATHARALTRALSRSRSHATLRTRAPQDAFRQYASLSSSIDTPWGREAASGSATQKQKPAWAPGSKEQGG